MSGVVQIIPPPTSNHVDAADSRTSRQPCCRYLGTCRHAAFTIFCCCCEAERRILPHMPTLVSLFTASSSALSCCSFHASLGLLHLFIWSFYIWCTPPSVATCIHDSHFNLFYQRCDGYQVRATAIEPTVICSLPFIHVRSSTLLPWD